MAARRAAAEPLQQGVTKCSKKPSSAHDEGSCTIEGSAHLAPGTRHTPAAFPSPGRMSRSSGTTATPRISIIASGCQSAVVPMPAIAG